MTNDDAKISAILTSLETLLTATGKYVDDQTSTNEYDMEVALQEHYKALCEARERVRAAMVGITQMEFNAATVEGKRMIATQLQDDLGNMGVQGALSCAVAGVTGRSTKLYAAWKAGELFGSQQGKVQEEKGPLKKGDVPALDANGGVRTDGTPNTNQANEATAAVAEKVTQTFQSVMNTLNSKLYQSDVKAEPGPKKRGDSHQAVDDTSASGEKSRDAAAPVAEKVTQTFQRLMGTLGSALPKSQVKEGTSPKRIPQAKPTSNGEAPAVSS